MPNEFFQLKAVNNFEIKTSINYTSSRLFTSKVHQFENLPEPKNATEEEQEAFHSKTYDFSIPDNSSIFKGDSKRLSKEFKKLQISSKNDIPIDHKKETMQQMKGSMMTKYIIIQTFIEFEIPDDGF
ncbi:kinase-like domain-containing protein [Rhizophagus irregularis DAOM 181602=DAOM 197198]|nr:kinase-like domain-containing protein [Rhizophagus irregularis DAOM 181602=DAOM 197198]